MIKEYLNQEFEVELFDNTVEFKKRIMELIKMDRLCKVSYSGKTSEVKAKRFSIYKLSKSKQKLHTKSSVEYQQDFLTRFKDYPLCLIYNK